MAVLCYIWILWIIPLLTDSKNEPFVRFHINQGIILTIFSLAAWVLRWIPFIGGFLGWAAGVFLLVLSIIGIINAINMEEKPVPILGTLFTVYK